MKKYRTYIIIILIISTIFFNCKADVDKAQDALSTSASIKNQAKASASVLVRKPKLIIEPPSKSIISLPTPGEKLFVVNKDSIPSDQQNEDFNLDTEAVQRIYYIPISSTEYEESLDFIKNNVLTFNQWHHHKDGFPGEISTLYFKEKNSNTHMLANEKIHVDTIVLDFNNTENPYLKVIPTDREGDIVRSNDTLYQTFTSWNINDDDICKVNDIENFPHPIRSGDTIYILFIQVAQIYKESYQNMQDSVILSYLKPINLESIKAISYVVN